MEVRSGFTLLQPRHSSLQLAQALQSVELIGLIRQIRLGGGQFMDGSSGIRRASIILPSVD